MCSMLRAPRREECTIWTAIAPDGVFTVRTYATTKQPMGPASAQVQAARSANPPVTALRPRETHPGDKSRVLPRLAGAGLVVAEPQRGFRVCEVSVEDLRQLTEARVLVESASLRQSIEHGDVQFESDLVASHHTLTRTPVLDDSGAISDVWLDAHAAFHHRLLAGSPNLRLRSIADSLRDATEIYRCWSCSLGDERDRDVPAEHRRILDATLARNADLAVAELTEHIEHTTRVSLQVGPATSSAAMR
jgi:DNA-binding GntR family transcriptional regulator